MPLEKTGYCFVKLIEKFNVIILPLISAVNHDLQTRYYAWFLRKAGVRIHGEPDYISWRAYIDNSDYSKIELGHKCIIGMGAKLLTHDYSVLSAAIAAEVDVERNTFVINEGVSIGENAFIGVNSLILPGVKVGDNTIVGAGSVVTKDTGDNVVVAGNPARVIRSIKEYGDSLQSKGLIQGV